MKTANRKLYEGMFLVDSAEAAQNWEGVNENVKTILERAGAEIESIRKWDERKLAYEINGKSRGTYILCYFRAEGGSIRDIEKAVRLSERIMRVLILSAEGMNKEDLVKTTPAMLAEQQKQKAAEEAAEKASIEAEEKAGTKQEDSEGGEERVEMAEDALEDEELATESVED